MTSFEALIRPSKTTRPWLREATGAGLLIAVSAILFSAWGTDSDRHFSDVVSQMYGFRMLPALGFALALRCGAVDLSIWSDSIKLDD